MTRLARVFLLGDPAAGLRPRGSLVTFGTVPSGAVLDKQQAVLGEVAEGTRMVIPYYSSEMEAEEASLRHGEGVAFRPTSALVASLSVDFGDGASGMGGTELCGLGGETAGVYCTFSGRMEGDEAA